MKSPTELDLEALEGYLGQGFVFNKSIYFAITENDFPSKPLGKLIFDPPWFVSLNEVEVNGSEWCPVKDFNGQSEPDDAQAWVIWAKSLGFLGSDIIRSVRMGKEIPDIHLEFKSGYIVRCPANPVGKPNWKWMPSMERERI